MKNQPTVLLVDDDLNLRKTLTDILKLKGFHSLAVGKGAEALIKVKQEEIAVALIDLRLEDMPGLEVLEGIKASSAETECILLTGYASQATAIEAINLGAFAYYLKPLDIDQMLLSIQQAIAKRQAGRDLKESQELYRTFINATEDMAFLKDDAFRYLIANEENARFLGKPLTEIIGKTDFELMEASLARTCRASDEAALKDNATVINVEPVGDRYYETRKFPVTLQDGKMGVGGYIRDVTEVRSTQEALRDSENHFRGLFEDSPISLWEEDFSGVKQRLDDLKKKGVKDLRTYFLKHPKVMEEYARLIKVTDVNKASLELFHVSSKEELVADLSRIFREDSYEEFCDELVSLAEGKKQFNWEGVNYTPDGQRLDIAMTWSVSPGHEKDLSKVIISLVDITERKKAEKALKESEERFRGLFEDSPISLWEEDFSEVKNSLDAIKKKGVKDIRAYLEHHPEIVEACAAKIRILDINRASVELFHADSKQQLLNEHTHSFRDGFYDHFREELVAIAEGKTKISWEGIHYTQDGSCLNIAGSMAVSPGSEADLSKVIVSIIDITERKKAEKALQESEERFRGLFENASVGIYRTTPDGRILLANPALIEMLGYSDFAELTQINLEEEGFGPEFSREEFRKLVETGEGMRGLESAWYRRDKSTIYVRESARAIRDAQGQVQYYEGIVEEVTERKLAEDQLRLQAKALDSAANAMVITNRDGMIEWVNPAYTLLTGYSAEDVLGKTPSVLKSGAQAPNFYKNLWDTILSGKTWRGELINKRKDGRLYHEEQTITPLLNAKGEIEHFIGIKSNITELLSRKQELEALAQVSEALRVAGGRKEMVPIILEQVQSLLHANGALMNWQDAETGDISVELGIDELGYETGRVFPAHTGVSGLILDTGEPYLTDDIYKDGLFLEPDRVPETIRALIGYPLISLGKPIGALLVGRPLPFTAEEERLLGAVANMAVNALQRVTLHEQTELRLQHLITLREIDEAITTSFDLQATLNVILRHALEQLGMDAACVLLVDEEKQELSFGAGLGFGEVRIVDVRLKIGEDYAGRAAQNNEPAYVVNLQDPKNQFKVNPQEFNEFVSYYVVPMAVKGKVNGVMELFHRTPLQLDAEKRDFLDLLMGQAAIAVDNAHMFSELQQSNEDLRAAYDATIEGWVQALDLRDKETEGHTLRVADMAVDLAREMGLPEEELTQMRRGALLHDIGKMAVPDAILNKPAGLTPEEWKIMRMHPVYAHDMLAGIAYLKPALEVPYCHHERWDGSGYPRGLKGEEIPLAARIFAVIDVWDALCSDRPYRPAWKEEDALKHIQKQSGVHFDPEVVKKFMGVMQKKAYFK